MRNFIIVRFTKYYYGDQVQENYWARYVTCTEEMGNAYKILPENLKGETTRKT
jgi:hypothetical protein